MTTPSAVFQRAADAARALRERAPDIAADTVARHYARVPELAARYGAEGRERCLEDAAYHLQYLEQAVASGQEALFVQYVKWGRALLEARNIPARDIDQNLECLLEAIAAALDAPAAAHAVTPVHAALQTLREPRARTRSFLSDPPPIGDLARRYLELLLDGRRQEASRMIVEAVEQGTPIRDIYLMVFQPVQRELGRLWQVGAISVAQEHYCTAATQMVISQLYPYLFTQQPGSEHTLVATCVAGDLHEIGVRMVADFFEMAGWDTHYLGASTPTGSLLALIEERRPDVLAVSATITTHVGAVKALIARVRETAIGRSLRVMVGGYPFNLAPELAGWVGADATAADAQQAIDRASAFIASRR